MSIGAATPHPGSTELTEVRPLSRKERGEQKKSSLFRQGRGEFRPHLGSGPQSSDTSVNSDAHEVTIVLNGQSRPVSLGTSVADLLKELQIAVAHVAVEVNLELVPRARHSQLQLADGDRVEVVTLVGGG